MDIGQNEIWRSIDCNLNYEISSHGRVRNNKTGRIMKQSICGDGYYGLNLSNKATIKKLIIHRLVAEAFCEKNENDNIVDHIDRNRSNNYFENLRWCSQEINCKNMTLSKRNKSGIKGIHFHNKKQKWIATWNENKKPKTKEFILIEEAIQCRKDMELLHNYTN